MICPNVIYVFDVLIKVVGLIFSVAIFVWYILNYIKIAKIEDEIFEVKNLIDNLEQTIINKRRGIAQNVLMDLSRETGNHW